MSNFLPRKKIVMKTTDSSPLSTFARRPRGTKNYLLITFLTIFILSGCPPPQAGKKMPRIFALSYSMETGREPSFLIADDFNRNHILDLVVANSGGHSFSFYKGNGDGTFKKQRVFKTGKDPICLVSADFNDDGYKDIAVLNYADQTIQIYLNTRLGSFQKTAQLLKPGKIPINMASADFNGDGKMDLVVTMRFSNVVVMSGKGNGYFLAPRSMAVKGQPTGVVVGDYNRDGMMDVAVALAGTRNKGVQILWGQSGGKFESSKVFKAGRQPLSIVDLDMNNDGLTDFVTSSNSLHSLTAIVNNGDKTFNSLRDFASGNFPKFVVAADFTGDGLQDIAVSNATDDVVTVSLGKGDGTFTYPPIYHTVDEHPQGMAVGDFNGDGLIDIAVSCRDKNLIDILSKKNMINPKPDLPQKNPSRPDLFASAADPSSFADDAVQSGNFRGDVAPLVKTDGAGWGMEAPGGIEPPIEILQTSALPLGDGAQLGCDDDQWSGRRDSNPRPQPWQGCTLPLSYSRIF